MKQSGIFDRVRFVESRVDRMEAIILAQSEALHLLESAMGVRKAIAPNAEPIQRRMAQIAIDVAADNGLTLAELRSKRREYAVSRPRQFAMLEMSKAGFPANSIARFFGVDHTTVLHGIKVAAERLAAMGAQ